MPARKTDHKANVNKLSQKNTFNWSKRSECAALGSCRQNVVTTVNVYLRVVLQKRGAQIPLGSMGDL